MCLRTAPRCRRRRATRTCATRCSSLLARRSSAAGGLGEDGGADGAAAVGALSSGGSIAPTRAKLFASGFVAPPVGASAAAPPAQRRLVLHVAMLLSALALRARWLPPFHPHVVALAVYGVATLAGSEVAATCRARASISMPSPPRRASARGAARARDAAHAARRGAPGDGATAARAG